MAHLVWFRNDLRVADNPALTAACQSGQQVIACFLPTPEQWQRHDWSPARLQFVAEHVAALGEELAALGIPLEITESNTFNDSLALLFQLCEFHQVSHLHFNEEYGLNERRRDQRCKQLADQHGVKVSKYRDQTIAPVGSVLTQQHQPYTVFTPFSRRWRAQLEEQPTPPWPVPKAVDKPCQPPERWAPELPAETPPMLATGEAAAHLQLNSFLAERGRDYKKHRDMPALPGTSGLSAYLANGVLSGRQCLYAAQQALGEQSAAEGIQCWINELCWRDFYIHILYHFPRVSMHKAFKEETEALQWNPAGSHFAAWKQGQTGIPLVDAAMRQLNQTGWMHNRLRMVTAMFLTKNLFIDWRLGEAYFMSRLVDGFLASNNGGWQWSASTGTDAAPYFRVFNPVSQSEKFDPDGTFIRQYVPELAKLDNKRIHQPWTTGVIPGGYPRPIVDLKTSRQEAIEKFKLLKG